MGGRVRQPSEGTEAAGADHSGQRAHHPGSALYSVPYWKDAFIIVGTLPFAAIGGVFTLFITHTSFSISAAVGFTSLTGVATLGAVVFLSGIRRAQREEGPVDGLEKGCLDEMRPVVMACFAAGLGLLPAAVATEIGAQAQQPLARVVVGGMVTTMLAILFIIPLMARKSGRDDEPGRQQT